MKNNQKGFVKLVLIGALIILVGAISYFAWSKKSNNVNTEPLSPVTPQTDTSNWKTYTNTRYGFEVKYPPQLKLNETYDTGGIPTFVWICDCKLRGNSGGIYTFFVKYSSDLKSVYPFTTDSGTKWQDNGWTTIDGVATQKLSSLGYFSGRTIITYTYLIQSKNIAIIFTNPDESQISMDIDNILQSFKFIKPIKN